MKINGKMTNSNAITRIIAADIEGETLFLSFLSSGLKIKARMIAPKKALR